MKILIFAAAVLAVAAPSMASDVGVSINVGQPGFYGRIDIGSFPQPAVVYAEPVIIQQAPRHVGRPIYLRVPPGHMKKWSKHCGQYNACGQQVYFVQDGWYNNVYAPRYRSQYEGHHDHYEDGNRGDDDHHDEHGDNGKHKGHGKGHGKGHNKD